MTRRSIRMPSGVRPAKTIMVDPNWAYSNFGLKKHGAARAHYIGSSVPDLAKIPVADMGAPGVTLFGWASFTKVDEAVDLYRSWGFQLVTSWPWVKTVPSKEELAQGIGFWTFAAAELLMAFRRGGARSPRQLASQKQVGLLTGPKEHPVFYARRGAHSRKPLSLIEWIESRMQGPFLELFATGARPGWTCLGHETGWHLCEDGAIPIEEAKTRGLLRRHRERGKRAGKKLQKRSA